KDGDDVVRIRRPNLFSNLSNRRYGPNANGPEYEQQRPDGPEVKQRFHERPFARKHRPNLLSKNILPKGVMDGQSIPRRVTRSLPQRTAIPRLCRLGVVANRARAGSFF